MSRVLPRVGMEVLVVSLGERRHAVVEEVSDGGRTLVVEGRAFALHRLTAQYVLAGDPSYGTRLVLTPPAG